MIGIDYSKAKTVYQFNGMLFNFWSPDIPGERIVELPIALWFVNEVRSFMEVGAVLPEHGIVGHDCYDPFSSLEGVIRVDAEEADIRGRNLLSVSTIEHFGRLEYGNTIEDEAKGTRFLQRVLDECRNFLVTIPLGFNKLLDQYLESLPKELRRTLKRGESGAWEESDCPFADAPYVGEPVFATGVVVVTNLLK